MQNHSGYAQNNIGVVPQYSIEGLSEEENAQLSEYLACIEESDRMWPSGCDCRRITSSRDIQEVQRSYDSVDTVSQVLYLGSRTRTIAQNDIGE